MNNFLKMVPSHKGILLMLCSSVCVCIGQLLWKLSVTEGLFYLIGGFGLYAVGALIMLYAYRFGRLSVLQPLLSMNYVLSSILAVLFLGEVISIRLVCGIALIIAGVFLIGRSEKA